MDFVILVSTEAIRSRSSLALEDVSCRTRSHAKQMSSSAVDSVAERKAMR